jgi:3',5'-nucleoside bisphosphate phosphatase
VRIDLHIHSTASDGSLSAGAVVAAARAGNLHIIALADHDTVAGYAEAAEAARGALHVIPAIELSTIHEDSELHLLGYFIDPLADELKAYTARAAGWRDERMRQMLERLAGLGIRVSYETVLRGAGTETRTLGRPHLARALMEAGHVTSFAEAFDRFLGDGGPAHIPVHLLTATEAIEMVHRLGGLAVWAHPRQDVLEKEIAALADAGLDGIECYRPRVGPADAARIENAAARHGGLLLTGGSDWHGIWSGRLGDFAVTRDEVGPFLDRGGI